MFNRLPRFERSLSLSGFLLTERDHHIIRQIHRHRFLRSSQIIALVGGSPQQILRRLKLLYHHGYLERPRCQLDYFHKGGSHHMVYSLGGKSRDVLKQAFGIDTRIVEKNQTIGRVYLDHALLVSDVMVAIERACRNGTDVRLLYEDELPIPAKISTQSRPFHWKVKLNGEKLSAIPDRVFALNFKDENDNSNRTYFFLEADRGTMPVMRGNLSQSSFHKKLVAYEATWNQNIHRRRFGFDRIRVLTVTTIPGRVSSFVQACSQLKTGHGLFLFADTSILQGDILRNDWQTGKPGLAGRLIE